MGRGNFTLYDAHDIQELRQIAEDSAATLASVISEMGEETCHLNILGLKRNGQDIGDWSVTVQRKEPGICH